MLARFWSMIAIAVLVSLLGACKSTRSRVPNEELVLQAEEGDPVAQCAYGLYLLYDAGPQAQASAIPWLKASANKGQPEAMCLLGLAYMNSRGVEKDAREARRYFMRSATAGFLPAHAVMARLELHAGDTEAGLPYMRVAAAAGDKDSQKMLAKVTAAQNRVPSDPAAAVDYWRSEASDGNPMAAYKLGECYEQGKGIAPNPVMARAWYRTALESGYTPARQRLKNLM